MAGHDWVLQGMKRDGDIGRAEASQCGLPYLYHCQYPCTIAGTPVPLPVPLYHCRYHSRCHKHVPCKRPRALAARQPQKLKVCFCPPALPGFLVPQSHLRQPHLARELGGQRQLAGRRRPRAQLLG